MNVYWTLNRVDGDANRSPGGVASWGGPKSQCGFSLVEVMVAILILGVALAGLTHGITTALASSKESEWQAAAALFAAGKIETLRAEDEISNGDTDGECGEGMDNYSWNQTISATDIDGLHEVVVKVSNKLSKQEIYELRTLLFQPGGDSADQSTDEKAKRKRSGGATK